MRLRLWMHWKALKPQLDEAFRTYEEWGIEGVMIDFMDRELDEIEQVLQPLTETGEIESMLSIVGRFDPNRVQIIASQISGVPAPLSGRWTPERLHHTVMSLVADGRLDVGALVSHVVPTRDVVEAYRLLDEEPEKTLEVVLDFREVPEIRGGAA